MKPARPSEAWTGHPRDFENGKVGHPPEITGFSKYRLAKAFVRWTRDHKAAELSDDERRRWKKLIDAINLALK